MTTERPHAPPAPPRTRFGALVVFGALGAAVLATVFAGLVLDNALDGRLRDRAIWGVLLMAVGFLGPVVAVLVVVRRRQIVRAVEARRWGAVALFPGSFVVVWLLVFLGYGNLGGSARTPIVPYTPKFVVQFYPDGRAGFTTLGEFGGGRENRGESYTHDVGGGEITFAYRVAPSASGESVVAFTGTIAPPAADRTEVRGALVLGAKVRVQIEGSSDAVLTIDDRPRALPAELGPGTYRIAIRGTPARE